jgi:hypothetical protein
MLPARRFGCLQFLSQELLDQRFSSLWALSNFVIHFVSSKVQHPLIQSLRWWWWWVPVNYQWAYCIPSSPWQQTIPSIEAA